MVENLFRHGEFIPTFCATIITVVILIEPAGFVIGLPVFLFDAALTVF